jgi:WD40 repeat protein
MIISRAMRISRTTCLTMLALCLSCAQAIAQNQTTNKTGSVNASKPQLVMQTGQAGAVEAVALSPDGRIAVTGSADGSACLWEAASGREIRCLTRHESGVAHEKS